MKKPTRKLAVRQETLRTLVNLELCYVNGGEATRDAAGGCPLAQAVAVTVICTIAGG